MDDAGLDLCHAIRDFVSVYYGKPAVLLPNEPMSAIPSEHVRLTGATEASRQYSARYLSRNMLAPRLPNDAVCLIALTSHDLWSGGSNTFVFGLALKRRPVGILSTARLAEGGESKLLLRTFKTATHEIGHTFRMKHCVRYMCNMNGRNSLAELDRHPVYLCPECLMKVAFVNQDSSIQSRFEQLHGLAKTHSFRNAQAYYLQARTLSVTE